MTKLLVFVYCVIILCSLLAVPLLEPTSPTFQGEPQTTLQSNSQPTPQPTPNPTPQIISQSPKSTPTSTPQSTPQTTSQPSPTYTQQPTNRTLKQAIANATNYLAQTKEPYVLLMLNVLYRRFGITEFKDSLQTYDEQLATNPKNAPILRVFRRMADYINPVLQTTDFYAVNDPLDRLTVPALYSDRSTMPDTYLSMLTDTNDRGGYLSTHALLATIWLQDNHCNLSMPDNFVESLYHANAALIGNDLVVTDLELEAAAFLYLAGQSRLVDYAFVQRVVATQNYDGGWSFSSDTADSSYEHTSALGLMLLLHVEFPAFSYPPMLSPAPDYNGV
jgi:hypothetical protein